VKSIKVEKVESDKAEDAVKKVIAAKTDKTPGQAAAAADAEAEAKDKEAQVSFPTVTDCAPYKAEIENGLERLDGIRGKSVKQELLGRCQDKWLWEKKNGEKFI